MNTEELLKVRYKVIADYPDTIFKIGGILVEGEKDLTEASKYPHIFKKLEWWENRQPVDMPEYAKDTVNNFIGKVFRILDRGLCIGYKDNLVLWENCLPVSTQEFLTFKPKHHDR